MRAATIRDGTIVVAEHPDPAPGRGEVLVRVQAAGVNAADLMQVRGHYPPPAGVPVDIPGPRARPARCWRAARDALRFEVDQRVMGIVGGGGQAELAVVHERQLMPVPARLSTTEAGGVPEAFTTAHDALFVGAQLRPGERLLVHGAAGGVGSAAVQLARAAGARVTATVRDPQLRERVRGLGAVVIAPDGFAQHGPFDVILELVGAPNLPDDVQSLTTGGRIAVIGLGAGAQAQLDLGLLMHKRARIHGSTLRPRPLEEKALAARRVEREVLPLLECGSVTVPLAGTFPLEQVSGAYERFAVGGKLGKIVLEIA